jgi:hypothetical protein
VLGADDNGELIARQRCAGEMLIFNGAFDKPNLRCAGLNGARDLRSVADR